MTYYKQLISLPMNYTSISIHQLEGLKATIMFTEFLHRLMGYGRDVTFFTGLNFIKNKLSRLLFVNFFMKSIWDWWYVPSFGSWRQILQLFVRVCLSLMLWSYFVQIFDGFREWKSSCTQIYTFFPRLAPTFLLVIKRFVDHDPTQRASGEVGYLWFWRNHNHTHLDTIKGSSAVWWVPGNISENMIENKLHFSHSCKEDSVSAFPTPWIVRVRDNIPTKILAIIVGIHMCHSEIACHSTCKYFGLDYLRCMYALS